MFHIFLIDYGFVKFWLHLTTFIILNLGWIIRSDELICVMFPVLITSNWGIISTVLFVFHLFCIPVGFTTPLFLSVLRLLIAYFVFFVIIGLVFIKKFSIFRYFLV